MEEVPLIAYVAMIIPLAGMSIPIVAIITEHRRKQQAIEVMRQYAERGQEPPASVLEAMKLQSSNMMELKKAAGPDTGPQAWPKFAFFLMMGLGFAGLTYYFYLGGPSTWMFVVGFGIPAFVMAALSLKYLVGAMLPPSTDGK